MATNTGTDQLKQELRGVFSALGDRAVSGATSRVSGMTERLTDAAGGGAAGKAAVKGGEAAIKGKSPVGGALKGGLSGLKDKAKEVLPGLGGGGGGKSGKATKSTVIVEEIDVGVPLSVAYNQWTQYRDWPEFMKKAEHAEQEEDEPTVEMKAQVFWSHRRWTSTIVEQIPDERIVWRSEGEKGHIDGTVTFHELAPRLTRILVVLEYYPQGFFERTGNIWRAQGRRARLEIKHFRRHVMMNTALDPDSVDGWRGEIHDEQVERTHDEVVAAESDESGSDESGSDESGSDESGSDESGSDESGSDDSEDQYDEGDEPDEESAEAEDQYDADDSADEADEADEDDYDEEPQDEYEGDEEGSAEEPDEEPEDEYEDEEEPEEEPDEEPEDEYEEEPEDVEQDEEEPEQEPEEARAGA
jgi:uncharacterized membrane protein